LVLLVALGFSGVVLFAAMRKSCGFAARTCTVIARRAYFICPEYLHLTQVKRQFDPGPAAKNQIDSHKEADHPKP
jgi:hypothetical protein